MCPHMILVAAESAVCFAAADNLTRKFMAIFKIMCRLKFNVTG